MWGIERRQIGCPSDLRNTEIQAFIPSFITSSPGATWHEKRPRLKASRTISPSTSTCGPSTARPRCPGPSFRSPNAIEISCHLSNITLGSQEVRYLNSTLKPLKDTQRICHSDT